MNATPPSDLTPAPLFPPFYVEGYGCFAAVVPMRDGDTEEYLVWVYPISTDPDWEDGGPAEDSADGAEGLLDYVAKVARENGFNVPITLTPGL